jgi:lipid-A-disaccharide synthase-like uncharacterized protein
VGRGCRQGGCRGRAHPAVRAGHRRHPADVTARRVDLVDADDAHRALLVLRIAHGDRGAEEHAILVVFVAVAIEAIGPDHGLVRFDYRLPWLVAGLLGTALWSGRFVVQWWESERRGHVHLPASFFWMSLVGSVLLFAYAVYRRDYVKMAAFALNPIPYARNLILIARHKATPGPT